MNFYKFMACFDLREAAEADPSPNKTETNSLLCAELTL